MCALHWEALLKHFLPTLGDSPGHRPGAQFQGAPRLAAGGPARLHSGPGLSLWPWSPWQVPPVRLLAP